MTCSEPPTVHTSWRWRCADANRLRARCISECRRSCAEGSKSGFSRFRRAAGVREFGDSLSTPACMASPCLATQAPGAHSTHPPCPWWFWTLYNSVRTARHCARSAQPKGRWTAPSRPRRSGHASAASHSQLLRNLAVPSYLWRDVGVQESLAAPAWPAKPCIFNAVRGSRPVKGAVPEAGARRPPFAA